MRRRAQCLFRNWPVKNCRPSLTCNGASPVRATGRTFRRSVTGDPLARLVNGNTPHRKRSRVTNVMTSRYADAMMNAFGACMVVVGIAAIDERVRTYLANVLTGDPSSELVHVGVHAQRFARIVMDTADAHGSDPVALALLAVVSLMLGALMLRT